MNPQQLYPDFLTNPADYDASARAWAKVWDATDEFVRVVGGWTTPWLDGSWRDGNPIFSAWSHQLGRGLRIIQHGEPAEFCVWRNTFGERGTVDAVDELVISCALTADTLERVRLLVSEWLLDRGIVNSGRRPRGAIEIELASPIEQLDVERAA